jgi:IS5 family transposase
VKLHGDKGYDYRACRQALARRGIKARIARKGIEASNRLGRHRYVVERCLEWVTRFRRLPPCHADVRQPVYQGILFLDGPEESTSA